ncbi:uncharacterized protein LOC127376672 [Dicentrarchus labrax]|uniref:Grass carp reovirus (GCRV)-induced gene 2p n=1 Tax=Dicentrarchus labrax TaxID=13489 RepID=A0A8P4GDL5_DICLA|nr:uncharacterized protein LOC127376672 [Dicentrarchus labrax]XP_051279747.1 uncharacterized protein LOC127376672 [Dicentrarchus labrax]
MPLQFSGWEVVDDGASFPGVELTPSQKPQQRGVYTMFHGTSVTSARLIIANGFKQSTGGNLGVGVYVSRDKQKAARYPLNCQNTDRVIFQLRVRPGRVKRIDPLNHPMQFTWHANGYDTAWMPPNVLGLEEDCVFDPKRVEVVGIANAPNPTIQAELEQLLAKTSKKPEGGGDATAAAAAAVCSLCKRKTQQGSPHIKQQCWDCGKNICILMIQHFCPAKPGPGGGKKKV